MESKILYLKQGGNIIVVIDGSPHTIGSDHINFGIISEALSKEDWQTVRETYTIAKTINRFTNGSVTVEGEDVSYRGVPVHGVIAERMIKILEDGQDVNFMALFLENLMKNPDPRAVQELYGFLEACDLPLTKDGHFLAYKVIRQNWYDTHSGTVFNKPLEIYTEEDYLLFEDGPLNNEKGVEYGVALLPDGSKEAYVEMTRHLVDANKDVTCSTGLHFCSMDYIKPFTKMIGEGRIVSIKINPADVVAIPSDYNNTKGRCCRYSIVNVVSDPNTAFVSSIQDRAHEELPDDVLDAWEYYDDGGW